MVAVRGKSYLFQLVSGGGGVLQMIELRDRDTSPLDYEGTISFIDNSNLRHAFSKTNAKQVSISTTLLAASYVKDGNKKRDRSGMDAITSISNDTTFFPIIAFKLKKKEDQWFLGVAFSLYPKNMIIAKADVTPDNKLILEKDLLLIDHPSSTYMMSSNDAVMDCSFSCRYLNLISKDTQCPVDGAIECSRFGPHRIHVTQVDKQILQLINKCQQSDKKLISVPKFRTKCKERKVYSSNPSLPPTEKNRNSIFCSPKTITVPVQLDPNPVDHAFAIPYLDSDNKPSPDSPSKMTSVRIAHLSADKMNDLLKHIHSTQDYQTEAGEVRIPHDIFNALLDEYSDSFTVMESHKLPHTGIAFEIKKKGTVETKEGKLPHERTGDLVAFCGTEDPTANRKFEIDIEMLDYIIRQTHRSKSSFTVSRHIAKCFGMNIYVGINSSGRPFPTPRKGVSSIKTSEFWNELQDPTFLPYLLFISEKLANRSNEIARAVDPVFDNFQQRVFSESPGQSERLACNNDGGLRFNGLQILTGPSKDQRVRGFANQAHRDNNDMHLKSFQQIARKILHSDLKDCQRILEDKAASPELRRKAEESLLVILHLLRLGGCTFTDEDELEQLSWSVNGSCGYKALYSGPSDRKLCAHFIFNEVNKTISLPFQRQAFIYWDTLKMHQTAFPYTHDKEFVYVSDRFLHLYAWGCGKSTNRLWLEGFRPDLNITGRLDLTRLINIVVTNNIVEEAIENTTLTQTMITNWLNR